MTETNIEPKMYDNQTYAREPSECVGAGCTLQAHMGTGVNNQPLVMERTRTYSSKGYGGMKASEHAETLTTDQAARCGNDNAALVVETMSVDSRNQSAENEVAHTVRTGQGLDACNKVMQTERRGVDCYNQVSTGDVAMPLTHAATDPHHVPCVRETTYTIAENIIGRKPENGGNGNGFQHELAYTAEAIAAQGVATRSAVRRITPEEAERLMGFPVGWTKIPYRGKPAEECPDGPRYKACGNSFCINVVMWIGQGIEEVERRIRGAE